jgi:hypothetical protein
LANVQGFKTKWRLKKDPFPHRVEVEHIELCHRHGIRGAHQQRDGQEETAAVKHELPMGEARAIFDVDARGRVSALQKRRCVQTVRLCVLSLSWQMFGV